MRSFVVLAVLLTLVACSSPKIDTSTDEAMQASVKKVREALPEADRDKFDKAMQTVALNQVDFGKLFGGKPDAVESAAKDMKAALHGKTGAEVIAMAGKIEEAERQRRRAAALKEIGELVKERDDAARSRGELAKFEVQRARFSKSKDYFGIPEPQILLRVKNGTAHPISRAYFRGKLTSPGRSVPWLEDEFNYSIRGGLEPGEEATWTLAPNMFSDWGRVEAPADAGLEVTVLQLDGPDEKPLFSTKDFTPEDAERLAALQREYGGAK
jgi:hypothetical protein